ncbi:nucleotide-binding alpha-beta plait domain-containing protein, partial [Tanacetum coccineum]
MTHRLTTRCNHDSKEVEQSLNDAIMILRRTMKNSTMVDGVGVIDLCLYAITDIWRLANRMQFRIPEENSLAHPKGFQEGFLEQPKPVVGAAIRQAIDKLKTLEQGTSSAFPTGEDKIKHYLATRNVKLTLLCFLGLDLASFVRDVCPLTPTVLGLACWSKAPLQGLRLTEVIDDTKMHTLASTLTMQKPLSKEFDFPFGTTIEVSRKKQGYKSKENDVAKISTSIFVTNFPEPTSAKDLFNACKVYGHVVDSFIPNKRAKNGKRFAFIRFINVFSVERLVSNLCTVWIEKHRLQANLAKYNRPSVNQNVKEVKSKNNYNTHKVGVSSRPSVSSVPTHVKGQANSFANVVNGTTSGTQGSLISSSPAIVIDDSCLVERDLSKQVMGKVKEFASIPKLSSIIKDEGFPDVSLTYLG